MAKLQLANVFAFAVTIAVNALANLLPINGQTTGAISDRFASYFVPAGFTFSIWGVIYAALAGFTLYQALPSQRNNRLVQCVVYLFILSCSANVAWILLWHYEWFISTLGMMLILLLSLLAIYLRLDQSQHRATGAERWLVVAPFSLYFGWITVATIANVTVVLLDLGWSGWGIAPAAWSTLLLLAAISIFSAIGLVRADAVYTLVGVWALAGIIVGQASVPMVASTAALGIIIVLGTLVAGLRRKRRVGPPSVALM